MQALTNTNVQQSSSVNDRFIIQLNNTGKRFNRDWIFRSVDYSFQSGKSYAITGPNGSGKSTLLQSISGAIAVNEGTIIYSKDDQTIDSENVFLHVAIVAPYLEVIEEMTATEFLEFHNSFKELLPDISIPEILEVIGLKNAAHKQIRFYSSGMKQRIKLAQAIFSNVPILLLDEPCTNLDTSGYDLYHKLINDYCKNKLVIVSSNDINEYDFCEERLSILTWK